MNNKKQTAIELLKQDIDSEVKYGTKMVINWDMYLELEKRQIIDTFDTAIKIPNKLNALINIAWLKGPVSFDEQNKQISEIPTEGEQYYNKTYEQ